MVVMDASSPAAAAPGSTAAGPGGHRHPGDQHDSTDPSHLRGGGGGGPHDPLGPGSDAANAGSPSEVGHDGHGLHGVHGGGGRWYGSSSSSSIGHQQQQQQMSGYMDEEVGAGRNSPSSASHGGMNNGVTNDYFPGGQGSSVSQSYGKRFLPFLPFRLSVFSIAFRIPIGCLQFGS